MPAFLNNVLYPIVGRMSLLADALRTRQQGAGTSRTVVAGSGLDGTGRVVPSARKMNILCQADGVIYVDHESFGHSFWRAQEFSLFREHKHLLSTPILDFGCGDGSFGSVAFARADFGADVDAVALQTARQFGVYRSVLHVNENRIPLEDEMVQSVVSNSVLEHVEDLDGVISEIRRVLALNGLLMFTVPVAQYERDLVKYFGKSAADRVNRESSHRHLLEVDDWRSLLMRHGFTVEILRTYQGDTFTFWFRMFRLLGERGLAMVIPSIRTIVWKLFKGSLVRMVKISISETMVGGNIFLVARKSHTMRAEQ